MTIVHMETFQLPGPTEGREMMLIYLYFSFFFYHKTSALKGLINKYSNDEPTSTSPPPTPHTT